MLIIQCEVKLLVALIILTEGDYLCRSTMLTAVSLHFANFYGKLTKVFFVEYD